MENFVEAMRDGLRQGAERVKQGAERVKEKYGNGWPVQIVKTGKDGKLTFDENALFEIIKHDSVIKSELAVLSVSGVFRSGKSFLLGYILRYLQAEGAAPSDAPLKTTSRGDIDAILSFLKRPDG